MTHDPEFIRTKLALDVALRAAAALVLSATLVVVPATTANAAPDACYTAEWAPMPCPPLEDDILYGGYEPGPRWPVDTCRSPGYSWGPGDDNCDGVIMEDEAGWDCRTMGNNVCGPGNAQGVPPGDYSPWDEGGMHVEGWIEAPGMQ